MLKIKIPGRVRELLKATGRNVSGEARDAYGRWTVGAHTFTSHAVSGTNEVAVEAHSPSDRTGARPEARVYLGRTTAGQEKVLAQQYVDADARHDAVKKSPLQFKWYADGERERMTVPVEGRSAPASYLVRGGPSVGYEIIHQGPASAEDAYSRLAESLPGGRNLHAAKHIAEQHRKETYGG